MAWETATNWMSKRFKAKFTTPILEWACREVMPLRRTSLPQTPTPEPSPTPASPPPPAEISPTPPRSKSRKATRGKIQLVAEKPRTPKTPTMTRSTTKNPHKTNPTKTTLHQEQTPRKTPSTGSATRKSAKRRVLSPNKGMDKGVAASTQTTPSKIRKVLPPPTSSPSSHSTHSTSRPKPPTTREPSNPHTTPTRPTTAQVHNSQVAGTSGHRPIEIPAFIRHNHRGNKTRNWILKPKRPYLIIGDSNVGRLPPIHHSEVQVDCYPGAKFQHITHILRHKTPVSPKVRGVILSVGLNNRKQEPRTHYQELIGALLDTADSTFPNAHIKIAALNWSDKLPLDIKANLIRIDVTIYNTHRAIPRMPPRDFRTEDDLLHWTKTTALKIWQHWSGFFDL